MASPVYTLGEQGRDERIPFYEVEITIRVCLEAADDLTAQKMARQLAEHGSGFFVGAKVIAKD